MLVGALVNPHYNSSSGRAHVYVDLPRFTVVHTTSTSSACRSGGESPTRLASTHKCYFSLRQDSLCVVRPRYNSSSMGMHSSRPLVSNKKTRVSCLQHTCLPITRVLCLFCRRCLLKMCVYNCFLRVNYMENTILIYIRVFICVSTFLGKSTWLKIWCVYNWFLWAHGDFRELNLTHPSGAFKTHSTRKHMYT